MEIDYSSYLPEPTLLRRSLIVEYRWGTENFKIVCIAADVRDEPWDTGETVTWLHCKAFQVFNYMPDETAQQPTKTFMIPASYITAINLGPSYRIAQGTKTVDIGLFPPQHPAPKNSLGPDIVRQKIQEMLTPERN